MTEKEEKLADKYLVKLMKDEPMQMIKWILIKLGQEMVAANAETMKITQDSDLKPNERYKVECKMKITKVKSLINQKEEIKKQ